MSLREKKFQNAYAGYIFNYYLHLKVIFFKVHPSAISFKTSSVQGTAIYAGASHRNICRYIAPQYL
jgi:hypothetical protein